MFSPDFFLTLKSCTPMQANINWSSVVTMTMLPMVLMATNTHCTTCWNRREKQRVNTHRGAHRADICGSYVHVQTFNPFALLMALSGLSTRSTRRIFTTLIALDLKHTWD